VTVNVCEYVAGPQKAVQLPCQKPEQSCFGGDGDGDDPPWTPRSDDSALATTNPRIIVRVASHRRPAPSRVVDRDGARRSRS
jgi:hypothetical protein